MFLGESTTRDALDAIVVQKGTQYGVDPNLIRAIITQESNWNINATRYEPKLNDSSIGLMQTLLKTAQWITGNNSLTQQDLLNPVTSIDAGTKYLQYLQGKYSNLSDVIAAYNAGSPIRTADASYINQSYVDSVSRYMTLYSSVGTSVTPIIASVLQTFTGGSEVQQADASVQGPNMMLIIGGAILLVDVYNAVKKPSRSRGRR